MTATESDHGPNQATSSGPQPDASDVRKIKARELLMEIAGLHSTGDAQHITRPDPEGAAAMHAIDGALADAGLSADEVSCYTARRTRTRANDAIEAGSARPRLSHAAVIAPKGVTGHLAAGAAAMEDAVGADAMATSALPPVVGFSEPDETTGGMDTVRTPREWKPGPVLNVSFALGGVNTAVVLRPVRR